MMDKQDKLPMMSKDLANEKFEALMKLFPNIVTETLTESGEVVRAIDVDALKQEINQHVVSGKDERYQFTWPDKKKSVLLANSPIAATLRPCRDESVDFDYTENLYIEGDNLDVIKLLRETYLNRVKVIFIDPPYNTGNDFIYEDDYSMDLKDYLISDIQIDNQGNRLVHNSDSNGRLHTDWLNMMYPRLKNARDLLSEDGVIFISIDDHEVMQLRKICDEIFGEARFISDFIWRKKGTSTNVQNTLVSSLVDHVLCYSKSSELCLNRRKTSIESRTYPFTDVEGEYRTAVIEKKDAGDYARSSMKFEILGLKPREGKRWQIGEKKARELENKGRFIIDSGIVKLKIYKSEDLDSYSANPNLLLEHGSTDSANKSVNIDLFGIPELFSNPKPIELLIHLTSIGTDQQSIVLDFFSGSSTTAHAVMKLNVEDGGSRKFIMVQLPEICTPESEAAKAGYKNICEIGKERIRRAGKKIKEEAGVMAVNLDIGFRVLKLDSSNMKDVYYTPEEYAQMNFNLDGFMDNIKPDRTDEDLLFQVMLDLGVPLSARIKKEGDLFYVDENYLVACFGEVDSAIITDIARKKPYYAVFRDSSFLSDSALVNVDQIFNTYSPQTIRRVL